MISSNWMRSLSNSCDEPPPILTIDLKSSSVRRSRLLSDTSAPRICVSRTSVSVMSPTRPSPVIRLTDQGARYPLTRSTGFRVECVDGSRRIDHRGAGVDHNGNTQSIHDLFLRRTGFDRGVGVGIDASVAAQRDRYTERDQFARLRVDACRLC